MCYLRLGELVSSDLYPRLLRVLKEDYLEIIREQGLPDKFLQPVGAVSEFITEFYHCPSSIVHCPLSIVLVHSPIQWNLYITCCIVLCVKITRVIFSRD